MAGKGGYQAPSKPAMSSGPGAMSQRTDGGPASKQAARYMAGGDYGDGTDMMNIQQSAPMAATPDVKGMPAGQVARAAQQAQVVPMNAPTQRPDEPISSGADFGAGPGMESLGLGAQDVAANDAFKASIAMYMPVLSFIASRPNTSPETRQVIRQLRNSL